MDEIVLGRDLDGSSGTALKQLLLEGAAGCKSIGVAPKLAGKRSVPGGDSQVDELIWGTDVDGSSDPALQKAKDQLFQGAAGSKGPPQLQGGTEARISIHNRIVDTAYEILPRPKTPGG